MFCIGLSVIVKKASLGGLSILDTLPTRYPGGYVVPIPLVTKMSPNLTSESNGINSTIIPLSLVAKPLVIPLIPFLTFLTGMC